MTLKYYSYSYLCYFRNTNIFGYSFGKYVASEYIRIFIRYIMWHPNIFGYSFVSILWYLLITASSALMVALLCSLFSCHFSYSFSKHHYIEKYFWHLWSKLFQPLPCHIKISRSLLTIPLSQQNYSFAFSFWFKRFINRSR